MSLTMSQKLELMKMLRDSQVEDEDIEEKNWIAGAIKKPGSLRKSLGVKSGKKIPRSKLSAAAKKGGKLGRRARLAMTLAKLRKK